MGFGNAPQPREFLLAETHSDPQITSNPTSVQVLQTSSDTFNVTVGIRTTNGGNLYEVWLLL